MSVRFENEVSPEIAERIRETFGKPVASTDRDFLYKDLPVIDAHQMSRLAAKAGQPVSDSRVTIVTGKLRFQI